MNNVMFYVFMICFFTLRICVGDICLETKALCHTLLTSITDSALIKKQTKQVEESLYQAYDYRYEYLVDLLAAHFLLVTSDSCSMSVEALGGFQEEQSEILHALGVLIMAEELKTLAARHTMVSWRANEYKVLIEQVLARMEALAGKQDIQDKIQSITQSSPLSQRKRIIQLVSGIMLLQSSLFAVLCGAAQREHKNICQRLNTLEKDQHCIDASLTSVHRTLRQHVNSLIQMFEDQGIRTQMLEKDFHVCNEHMNAIEHLISMAQHKEKTDKKRSVKELAELACTVQEMQAALKRLSKQENLKEQSTFRDVMNGLHDVGRALGSLGEGMVSLGEGVGCVKEACGVPSPATTVAKVVQSVIGGKKKNGLKKKYARQDSNL